MRAALSCLLVGLIALVPARAQEKPEEPSDADAL